MLTFMIMNSSKPILISLLILQLLLIITAATAAYFAFTNKARIGETTVSSLVESFTML